MTQSKRVLVIGSRGFIGSNLMMGHDDWGSIDLKDGTDIRDGIHGNYDVIILLAAHLEHTREAYQHNLEIYAALTDYLVGSKRRPHIVYTSSAAVYTTSNMRQYEFSDTVPGTIYGKSKLLGEKILEDIEASYTILRLANVYGAGEGNGVIDRFIRGGRKIYGDGKQIRDYVSVRSVVGAIEKIVNNPRKYRNQTYNISIGVGLTVGDVFTAYGSGEPVYREPRTFDVEYSVLDNGSAVKAGLLR